MGVGPTNTWPPLISGTSLDASGAQQLYGQAVVGSFRVDAQPNDGFFFPLVNQFTGFAADGQAYQNGAPVGGAPASWFSEAPGKYRGSRPTFPTDAILLLTDAGVSVLDQDNEFAMWMLFLRGDFQAYTNNRYAEVRGWVPTGISYQSGRIVVEMKSDPGSQILPVAACLVFDFTSDSVYLDSPDYDPPVLTSYSASPATYPHGTAITPNTPTLTGGRVTEFYVLPDLPAGLTLDHTTGIISGTPTTVTPATQYSIVAQNPGGATTYMLTLTVT